MPAGFETPNHGLIGLLRLCSASVRVCPATCGDTIHLHGCSIFCRVATPPSACLSPCGWTFGMFPVWGLATLRATFYLLLVKKLVTVCDDMTRQEIATAVAALSCPQLLHRQDWIGETVAGEWWGWGRAQAVG